MKEGPGRCKLDVGGYRFVEVATRFERFQIFEGAQTWIKHEKIDEPINSLGFMLFRFKPAVVKRVLGDFSRKRVRTLFL